MPAAVNCLMKPSGTRSGASVTSIAPLRGRVSVFKSSAVGARKTRGSCTPGFSGDRNGPSRWMPSTLGSRSTSIATAAIAVARFVRRIADEGGQKARRSKLAVRGRDRRDARLRRRVIEQHVAAAIDLQIDEAGREPCPVGQRADRHGRRQVRPRHDAGDMSVLDHDSGIAVHDHAVKDVVGGNRMPGRCVHRVRVIFCKCRGRSTSVPRRSARRMSRR